MAKVKSSGLRNYVGRLAGSIYYIDKGRNISREVAAQVSNPQTQAQMVQRVRLANLVNFYKANKEWMLKYAFEKLVGLQSVYNAFVSLNLRPTAVPLTKQQAAMGLVKPDLFTVTKGSLPVINQVINTEQTQIVMPGFEITPSDVNSIGQASKDLIATGKFKAGDQISGICVQFNSGGPCVVIAKEMILDVNDDTPLSDLGFSLDKDGHLCFSINWAGDTGITGGVIVLSRRVDGRVLVSSQMLSLNTAAIKACQGARSTRAYESAIASYGYAAEPFLDPAQNTLSMKHTVSVVASTDGTITGGGRYDYGTEVTISATAKPGYMFDGWAAPFNGQPNPFKLQVIEDVTIQAYFSQTE